MPSFMTEGLAVTDVGGGPPVAEVLAGRYRLDRQLGRGGMGTVHLAHDLVLDRRVAVKRLRDVSLEGEQARQRVLHEARALAALNHPGVAAVYDVLDLAPPAIVLEYVEGTTWDHWVDQGHRPEQVMSTFAAMLEAVAYAHGRGVVHCDLKPANIVVTDAGAPKVLDFGIAQLGQTGPDSASGSEDTRQAAFTPKWAAPEVLRGRTPTPAADVYALGVMLEELADECTRAHTPLPRSVARDLRRLGRRAQADTPEARPPDAAHLLRELPRLAPEGVVPAPRSSSRARVLALTAVLVGGGCVTGGLALVGARDAASRVGGVPAVAVVTRVDAAAASSMSAAAADLLRQSLGSMSRVRLISSGVPPFTDDVATLVASLSDQGLTYVVVPTAATMRSTTRLTASVLRASDGVVMHTATRFGAPERLPHLAAAVAGDVKAWFGERSAMRTDSPGVVPSMLSLGQYSQAIQYTERADIPGNLDRAIALLRETVMREPAYAAAHAQLGRAYWARYRSSGDPADLDAAQLALLEAMTRRPDLQETRITLALLLRERGRQGEAAQALHDALDAAPDDDVALRMLGELEAQAGSVDEGVALIGRAIELRPGSWAHQRALGATLFSAGRYADAAGRFEVLTQLQPDNPWGFQMLGAARQMLGDLDGAVGPYARSIEIRRTASALSNLATLHYARGDFRAAERLYRDAVVLRPRDPVMHRNLGDSLLRQNRAVDAAKAYEQSAASARAQMAVNPSDVRAGGTAAYVLSRLGRCDEADTFARLVEGADTPNPSVLANAANAWTICGRTADALRVVRGLDSRGATLATLLEADVLERLRALPEFNSLF